MLARFQANLATVLICAALALVVFLIIRSLVRNKKQGRSSCGCGCSTCPMSGQCHSNARAEKAADNGEND